MEMKDFEKFEGIIREYGFTIDKKIKNKDSDSYTVEISTSSPQGEDVIVSTLFDGSLEDYCKQFENYAANFDVYEHSSIMQQLKELITGISSTEKEIVTDAIWIKKTLLSMAMAFKLTLDNTEKVYNYKNFEKIPIGCSDLSVLILAGCDENGSFKVEPLPFGDYDSIYYAYIVTKKAKIGTHYKKVTTFTDWLKIYDDTSMVYSVDGKIINIYRAGASGCIIEVVNDETD